MRANMWFKRLILLGPSTLPIQLAMGEHLDTGPHAIAQKWLIEVGDGLWKELEGWGAQAFEQARVHGQNMVEYVWTYSVQGENFHTKYEVDVVNMTQTNTVTGHVRRLLRVAMLALSR